MRTHALLALVLAADLARAASAPTPTRDLPAAIVVATAADPDATSTTVRVLGPAGASRTLTTVHHAPGMVPRGVVDGRGGVWLVLADGPGRLGEPARLVRVEDDGEVRTLATDVRAVQRPALVEDGSVVVFAGGATGEGSDAPWRVMRVWPDGRSTLLLERVASWVLPVGGTTSLGGCVMVQAGPDAEVLCVRDGTVTRRWAFPGALPRDVSISDESLVLLHRAGGRSTVRKVSLSDGKTVDLDVQGDPVASPVLGRTTVAWAAPTALQVESRGVRRSWPWTGGRRGTVLEVSADGLIVTREDSVDAAGRLDGRLPARFTVTDTRTGRQVRLDVEGRVVEVLGVRGGRQ